MDDQERRRRPPRQLRRDRPLAGSAEPGCVHRAGGANHPPRLRVEPLLPPMLSAALAYEKRARVLFDWGQLVPDVPLIPADIVGARYLVGGGHVSNVLPRQGSYISAQCTCRRNAYPGWSFLGSRCGRLSSIRCQRTPSESVKRTVKCSASRHHRRTCCPPWFSTRAALPTCRRGAEASTQCGHPCRGTDPNCLPPRVPPVPPR